MSESSSNDPHTPARDAAQERELSEELLWSHRPLPRALAFLASDPQGAGGARVREQVLDMLSADAEGAVLPDCQTTARLLSLRNWGMGEDLHGAARRRVSMLLQTALGAPQTVDLQALSADGVELVCDLCLDSITRLALSDLDGALRAGLGERFEQLDRALRPRRLLHGAPPLSALLDAARLRRALERFLHAGCVTADVLARSLIQELLYAARDEGRAALDEQQLARYRFAVGSHADGQVALRLADRLTDTPYPASERAFPASALEQAAAYRGELGALAERLNAADRTNRVGSERCRLVLALLAEQDAAVAQLADAL